MKLVEHDKLMRARDLLNETKFEASFNPTSGRIRRDVGEHRSAEAEYKAARDEFYFGVGRSRDLFEESKW